MIEPIDTDNRSEVRRLLVRWWLLGISLCLLCLGQIQIFRNPPIEWLIGGYAMLLSGLTLFILIGGLKTLPHTDGLSEESSASVPRVRIGWLITAFLFAAFTAWRSINSPFPGMFFEQLLTWGAAWIALVAMVWRSGSGANKLRRWEYGLLVVLFAGALTVRLYRLDTAPAFLDQDEGVFALAGADARFSQYALSPFSLFYDSYPRLYPILIGISSGIMGCTIFAARLPSTLFGALGIVALYLLGRELMDWPGGLVAALFALTWAFHVQLTRYALNQPADPLFATLAFYFFLRGWRRHDPTDYMLSGIMTGLAQMFYLGGRMILIVLPVYLLCIAWRDSGSIRRRVRFLLLLLVASVITSLPQNFYLWAHQLPITTHLNVTILDGSALPSAASSSIFPFLAQQLTKSLMALFSTPDWDSRGWYGAGSNLMGPFGGGLLIIGFALSGGVMWRRPRCALPLAWGIATVIFGGSLTLYPPEYQRYLSGGPAFALLVGMGIYAVANQISVLLGSRRAYSPLMIGIGVGLLILNLLFYGGYYLPGRSYIFKSENLVSAEAARRMLTAYQAGKQVIIVGQENTPFHDTYQMHYLMAGKPYLNVPEGDPIDLTRLDPNKPYLFLVTPKREADLMAALPKLPGGILLHVPLREAGAALAFIQYESVPLSR